MSERLDLTGTEKVLEIGTGSGYQVAVLSHLAKQVYAIEIFPQLMGTARQRLQQLGHTNVTVIHSDGNLGWEQESAYDGIIVTAAALHIPPTLIQQLAEGGRMAPPLRTKNGNICSDCVNGTDGLLRKTWDSSGLYPW